MTEAIYKAQVNTPLGLFLFAVREIEPFAKETLTNLVQADMKIAFGNFRVEEIQKSNRRILSNMYPIKNAYDSNSGQWGWVKKLK